MVSDPHFEVWCLTPFQGPDQDQRLTMAATLSLEISYGQLAVFANSLPQPFNDWTDQHVSQGFAWRPGSVTFRSMVEMFLNDTAYLPTATVM